jgi:hypothetical protein
MDTEPVDLTPLAGWFSNNNSINGVSAFLYSTHYGNTALTEPVDITFLVGWFGENRNFIDGNLFLS